MAATMKDDITASAALLREGIAELLWPTRCAVCDTPGEVLCARCRRNLPFIDQLKACPICGSAWGRTICCECNAETLASKGLDNFPLEGCRSVTALTPETRRIIVAYKDRGERRLAQPIAAALAELMPPEWRQPEGHALIVPLPARASAIRRRGFDHMAAIATELQRRTGIPTAQVLRVRERRDQRELDAKQRLGNMRQALYVSREYRIGPPRRIVLIDDVMTTGATLFAAADALHAHGAGEVCALTFARV